MSSSKISVFVALQLVAIAILGTVPFLPEARAAPTWTLQCTATFKSVPATSTDSVSAIDGHQILSVTPDDGVVLSTNWGHSANNGWDNRLFRLNSNCGLEATNQVECSGVADCRAYFAIADSSNNVYHADYSATSTGGTIIDNGVAHLRGYGNVDLPLLPGTILGDATSHTAGGGSLYAIGETYSPATNQISLAYCDDTAYPNGELIILRDSAIARWDFNQASGDFCQGGTATDGATAYAFVSMTASGGQDYMTKINLATGAKIGSYSYSKVSTIVEKPQEGNADPSLVYFLYNDQLTNSRVRLAKITNATWTVATDAAVSTTGRLGSDTKTLPKAYDLAGDDWMVVCGVTGGATLVPFIASLDAVNNVWGTYTTYDVTGHGTGQSQPYGCKLDNSGGFWVVTKFDDPDAGDGMEVRHYSGTFTPPPAKPDRSDLYPVTEGEGGIPPTGTEAIGTDVAEGLLGFCSGLVGPSSGSLFFCGLVLVVFVFLAIGAAMTALTGAVGMPAIASGAVGAFGMMIFNVIAGIWGLVWAVVLIMITGAIVLGIVKGLMQLRDISSGEA